MVLSDTQKANRLKQFNHPPRKSLGHKLAFAFCILMTAFGIAAIVGLFMLMKDSLTL